MALGQRYSTVLEKTLNLTHMMSQLTGSIIKPSNRAVHQVQRRLSASWFTLHKSTKIQEKHQVQGTDYIRDTCCKSNTHSQQCHDPHWQCFLWLVTVTFDLLHTVVHHSLTSSYMPNFTEIKETFCGWRDIQTDRQKLQTGFIRSTLSKSRPKRRRFCHFNKYTNCYKFFTFITIRRRDLVKSVISIMIIHICFAMMMMSLPLSSHLATSRSSFAFSMRNICTCCWILIRSSSGSARIIARSLTSSCSWSTSSVTWLAGHVIHHHSPANSVFH